MLTRAQRDGADTVLVPGASGGVGGALVQLAKRRGARVVRHGVRGQARRRGALGPDRLLPRAPEDLRARWATRRSPSSPTSSAVRAGRR
jgi:NADPH:quinone reductase-like Zn-dependent oxidoreductase